MSTVVLLLVAVSDCFCFVCVRRVRGVVVPGFNGAVVASVPQVEGLTACASRFEHRPTGCPNLSHRNCGSATTALWRFGRALQGCSRGTYRHSLGLVSR